MFDDKIRAWLYLTVKTNISRRKLFSLYKQFNSVLNILNAGKDELEDTGILTSDEIDKILSPDYDSLTEYMGILQKNMVKVISIECECYPDMLRQIAEPPLLLYCRGRFIDLNKYLCIASVGSRNPSAYGKRMTYSIVKDLCRRGVIIVSGMAQGIDAVSHKAALDMNCPTVAFVANGVDIIYPRCNAELFKSIIKTGMVVSEYPLGTMPRNYYFPERNRLVAGVSKGLFISEAKVKSGTSITCSMALNQNKDVFALPGNVDSSLSGEPIRLIKEGAYPVTCAEDILCHYKDLYNENLYSGISNETNQDEVKDEISLPDTSEKINEIPDIPQNLTNEEKVQYVLKEKSLSIDEISIFSKISLEELNMLLLIMEMDGKIKNDNGIYYLL